MEAMIFAAGLGTRLYPVTRDRPKALAPFLDGTLLSYNLHYLADQGINHFVINTHHFASKIKHYLEAHRFFGLDIDLSFEEELLDTAGGLGKASGLFKSSIEPILLYNVDVITNLDLSAFASYHKESGNDATLAMRRRKSSRYLLFNQELRLKGWMNIVEKLTKPAGLDTGELKAFAFSGIQLIEPSLLNTFDPKRKYSLTAFYLEQMDRQKIGAYLHDSEYWFDCGNPDRISKAKVYLSQ